MKQSNVGAFRHQTRQFSRLVLSAGHALGDVYGKDRPSPKRVLEFVEALLVCPTEDMVRVHIARDQLSAEVCRGSADDMASGFDIESALSKFKRPEHETPFYLLASVLRDRARLAVEQLGEDWKPKP